jgi:uncharacterized protein (TIGR03067 family)
MDYRLSLLEIMHMAATAVRGIGRPLLICVATACLLPSALAQSMVPPQLLELQGTWLVTTAERAGAELASVRGGKLTFGEDSFELRAGLSEIRGKIRVRASLSPKQIDFRLPDGTVWLGIYAVTAKSLRVNFVVATATSQRPELFATSVEVPATLLVTRRAD